MSAWEEQEKKQLSESIMHVWEYLALKWKGKLIFLVLPIWYVTTNTFKTIVSVNICLKEWIQLI